MADDVRNGKAGKMPADQLVEGAKQTAPAGASVPGIEGFVAVPDTAEEELPF